MDTIFIIRLMNIIKVIHVHAPCTPRVLYVQIDIVYLYLVRKYEMLQRFVILHILYMILIKKKTVEKT